MLAAKKGEQLRSFQQGVLPFVVILVPVIGLIFLEPHLSMALLIALLAGSVMFTAGARVGHFLALGGAAGAPPLRAGGGGRDRPGPGLWLLCPGAAPARGGGRVRASAPRPGGG